MDNSHWDKIEALLEQALELPPHEHKAFLDEACEGNAAMRAELDSLLAGGDDASVYFEGLRKEVMPPKPRTRFTGDDPHGLMGQMVGPYRVLEHQGGGGMGVVYKAEDTRLQRPVALKFLLPTTVGNPLAKMRLTQEARAASALDHPNICTVYDIGETDNGLLYLAMAFYEGQTLKARLSEEPLTIEEALDVAQQMTRGLTRAHQADIIHRDIKPANLILTHEQVVKIVDFGLAKLEGELDITRTGTTMGTISYMSPEQVHGKKVTAQTDQWALGIVLFEMLTGKRPFDRGYEPAVLYAIVNEPAPPLTSLRPEAPPALARIVDRLLSKHAAQRYPTTDALLADLEDIALQPSRSDSGTVIGKPPPSIAVMPFENMSADPENVYFCDGLAEDLINALAQVGGMHVAARTSSFAFRHQPETNLATIGTKLKVGAALTGSVRKSGQRLRITARLVDTQSGYLMWSERYDRIMDDVFAIQDEITLTIVEKLKVELLNVEKDALMKRATDDLEAYHLYLKGRFHWNERTPAGLQTAVTYFEQAIAHDPAYAKAYVGLADAWMMMGLYGYARGLDVYPKGKEAAEQAIKIDPSLGEAYLSLAGMHVALEHDWQASEAAFQRALTLSPGNGQILHYAAGWLFSPRGRFKEALQSERAALRLDPVSLVYNAVLGIVHWWSGDAEKAFQQAQQTLALNPNFWLAHAFLGLALETKGQYGEAVTAFRTAIDTSRPTAFTLGMLGHALACAGATEDAHAILSEMDLLAKQEYVSSFDRAIVDVGLGDHEAAFAHLDAAFDEHAFWMIFLNIDQRLLPLHADPRFAVLQEKMGLSAVR